MLFDLDLLTKKYPYDSMAVSVKKNSSDSCAKMYMKPAKSDRSPSNVYE